MSLPESRRRFLASAGCGAALAALSITPWVRAAEETKSTEANPHPGPLPEGEGGSKAAPAKNGQGKPGAAPHDPRNDYGGFLMGIQTYTLRGYSADAMLDLVRRFDLHAIEVFQSHLSDRSTPQQVDAFKTKTAEQGIRILGGGVYGFGRDHKANERVFQFAKRAGIRNLSADPSPDSFESLEKLVEKYDVRIAIHNHGPGNRYAKISGVWDAIKDRNPKIGACADLGHFIRQGEDPVAAIRQFRGRLFGVHLKDFAEQKANTRGVILGKGHLDVVGVFTALREVQFPADGALSLEYEEKPKDPLDDVKQCLAVAAEASKKSLGKRTAAKS